MPFAQGWDLYALHRREDMHAALAELRDAAAVHALAGNVFLVTRYAEAERALRAPELVAGSGVAESFGARSGLLYDVMTHWLMAQDGATHERARGLVRRELTPRRVELLRPFIAATSERLAQGVAREAVHGRVDLVARLAFALPSEVIRALFCIEREEWQARVEPLLRPGASAEGGGFLAALAEYFFAANQRAASAPPEGLLARLRAPDAQLGALSELEVVANCVLLVSAAIDTTTGLIANTLLCLHAHPEQLARARADDAALAAAIEETLRFEPPALSCSRFAARALELGGAEIPAGAHVLISIAAASRDPARFPSPDRFDLARAPERSLAFGGGRHVCLGAALARLEAQLAVGALLRAAPALRLEGEVAWRSDNPTVRAPAALWASA
ncbi:MAG: cytochrome P450 [Deltaproteobacteria bacterium]|nr:cytochrome P450 [Deltaproteobacteria bacterium]